MAYVPINQFVYDAALAGAMAGMGTGSKVPRSADSGFFPTAAIVAQAFAQQFDQTWAASALSEYNLFGILAACQASWESRSPTPSDPAAFFPAYYADDCTALVALVKAGNAKDPTSPTWPVGGGITADFEWNPAGPAGGNVFIDWATLAPALAAGAGHGQRRVLCSFPGLVAHITTGVWPGIEDVEFIAGGASPVECEIVIDQGASLPGVTRIELDGVSLIGTLTSGHVFTAGPGTGGLVVTQRNGSALADSLAGGALVHVDDPGNVLILATGNSVYEGNLFDMAGNGSNVNIHLNGEGGVFNNVTSPAGTGTLSVDCDGGSAPNVSPNQQANQFNFNVHGDTGFARPVVLTTDETLVGIAPFTDVPTMSETFTPLTAQVLIRIIATITATPGTFVGKVRPRIAFGAGQSGSLSPGSSSTQNSGSGPGVVVYEGTLTGLKPGVPNSVTVAVQWSVDNVVTLACNAGTDPDHFSMTLTCTDYQG